MEEQQVGMLSDKESKAIATELNKKFDIPFFGEKREQAILVKLVKELDQVLFELLPVELYEIVKNAADGISEKEIEVLKARLPVMINQKVNIPFLSEKVEGMIFQHFVELLCQGLEKGKTLLSE